jgi:hypothetical protein
MNGDPELCGDYWYLAGKRLVMNDSEIRKYLDPLGSFSDGIDH